MDTPGAVSRTAGAQACSQLETRRSPPPRRGPGPDGHPRWSRCTTKGAEPRTEHGETSYKLLLGAERSGLRGSLLLCFLVLGGPSCVCSVLLFLPCVPAMTSLFFFSYVTGAVPRTGKVFQVSLWQSILLYELPGLQPLRESLPGLQHRKMRRQQRDNEIQRG